MHRGEEQYQDRERGTRGVTEDFAFAQPPCQIQQQCPNYKRTEAVHVAFCCHCHLCCCIEIITADERLRCAFVHVSGLARDQMSHQSFAPHWHRHRLTVKEEEEEVPRVLGTETLIHERLNGLLDFSQTWLLRAHGRGHSLKSSIGLLNPNVVSDSHGVLEAGFVKDAHYGNTCALDT